MTFSSSNTGEMTITALECVNIPLSRLLQKIRTDTITPTAAAVAVSLSLKAVISSNQDDYHLIPVTPSSITSEAISLLSSSRNSHESISFRSSRDSFKLSFLDNTLLLSEIDCYYLDVSITAGLQSSSSVLTIGTTSFRIPLSFLFKKDGDHNNEDQTWECLPKYYPLTSNDDNNVDDDDCQLKIQVSYHPSSSVNGQQKRRKRQTSQETSSIPLLELSPTTTTTATTNYTTNNNISSSRRRSRVGRRQQSLSISPPPKNVDDDEGYNAGRIVMTFICLLLILIPLGIQWTTTHHHSSSSPFYDSIFSHIYHRHNSPSNSKTRESWDERNGYVYFSSRWERFFHGNVKEKEDSERGIVWDGWRDYVTMIRRVWDEGILRGGQQQQGGDPSQPGLGRAAGEERDAMTIADGEEEEMVTTSLGDGVLNQPLSSSHDKARQQTSLGISLLQKNDPAGALLLCNSATLLQEENVEGWVCLGDARLMTAAVMRAAITEEEEEDEGWKELVTLAMSDYKRATTLDPTNAHARSHLGLSHLLLSSSSSDALLHLSPISSYPSIEGHAAAYNTALAHLTSERQQQRRLALPLLRQLHEKGENSSKTERSLMAIRLNLAGVLLSMGRYNEARQVLMMAKELCDGIWDARMDKDGDIGDDEEYEDKEVLCAAIYNNWGLAMEMTGKGEARGINVDDEEAISTAYHRSAVWDRQQHEPQESSTEQDDDSDDDDELTNDNNHQAPNTTAQDIDNDGIDDDDDEEAAPSSSSHFDPTPSPHLELALRALESRAASSSLSEEKSVGLWISLSKARSRAGDVSGAVEAATKAVEMSSQSEQLSTAMSVLDDALQLMTSTKPSIIAEDDTSSLSSSSSSSTMEKQSQQQHTVTTSSSSSSSDDLNTLRLQLEIQQLKLELLQQTVQNNNDKNNNMKSARGTNIRRQMKFSARDDYNHIDDDDDDDDGVYDDYDQLYNDRRRKRRRRGQHSRQKKQHQRHVKDEDEEDIDVRPSKQQRQADTDNNEHILDSEETKETPLTVIDTDNDDSNMQSIHDTMIDSETIQPSNNDNDEGSLPSLDDVTDDGSSTVTVDTSTITIALQEETIDEANEMSLDDDISLSLTEDMTTAEDTTTISIPNPPTTNDNEFEQYQEVSYSLPPLYTPPSIERTPLPPVATSLVKMADAYLTQSNYKLAASQFSKVLKKAPTHLPALIGRATCLERMSQSSGTKKQMENFRRDAADVYADATRLAIGQKVEDGMIDALFRRALRMGRGLRDKKGEFLKKLLALASRYELMFEVLTVMSEMEEEEGEEERRQVLLMTNGVYNEWKNKSHGRSLVLLGRDIVERYEGNTTTVGDGQQQKVMKGALIQAKMYFDQALSPSEDEVELDEAGRVEALFYKGRVLTMMGDISTVMTVYNEALKLPTTEMTKLIHHHLAVVMDGTTDEAKTHFEKSLELGMHVTTEAINALGETHPSIITASSRQKTTRSSAWSSSPYDTQSRKGGILSGGDIVSSQSIFTKQQQQQQQTTASGTTSDYTLDALEQGGASYDGEIPDGEEDGDSSLGKVSKQRQL